MLTQFKNKNILITGGTGSFGQALAKTLLESDLPNKVIIFSRDEWKQWNMRQIDPIFNHPKIRYFLGDIRDLRRLERAFSDVHFIVHAAALKQVPAAEYNPSEFIQTNVMGAMNIIDAAINCKVEKVIALSTDKAVNPVNLYGATKLCSDKLFVAGNSYVGSQQSPKFSVVRYGNVSGSRGSIIPLWKKMVAEGASSIPITDVDMTRFWISLKQSVNLVLEGFNSMQGGEIFVPKIPSIKISELAHVIAPGIPHHYIGLREGEKLHEQLINIEDGRHTLDMGNFYIILPEIYIRNDIQLKKFLNGRQEKQVPKNFFYASNTNTEWLDHNALKNLIEE